MFVGGKNRSNVPRSVLMIERKLRMRRRGVGRRKAKKERREGKVVEGMVKVGC